MVLMVGKYSAVKMEVSAMLRRGKKNLVLAHGYPDEKYGTFRVPDGKIFVFVSEPGKLLSQDFIDDKFYELFSNPGLLGIPDEWIKRTYVAGSVCPNVHLDPKDSMWPGMGLHALPLNGFLAKHPNRPGDPVKNPRDLAKKIFPHNPTFKNDVVKGRSVDFLSKIQVDGVVFVVACRKVFLTPNVSVVRTAAASIPAASVKNIRARAMQAKEARKMEAATRQAQERAKLIASKRERGLEALEREKEKTRMKAQRKTLAKVRREYKPMQTDARFVGKRKETEVDIANLFGGLSLQNDHTKKQRSIVTGMVLDQRKKSR